MRSSLFFSSLSFFFLSPSRGGGGLRSLFLSSPSSGGGG